MILHGDCRAVLPTLPAELVQCCVTSPPYWGLRDYGVDGQIGLEPTPEEYVAGMVEVFREVRRVLRPDGTLWLNLGDSYAANRSYQVSQSKHQVHDYGESNATRVPDGLKPKDLVGIPWRVAFALQADGWYLRSDIIWHKPNPMPESVRDRPTKAHEYVFLLTKAERYFYDAAAVQEQATGREPGNVTHKHTAAYAGGDEYSRTKGGLLEIGARETRNARSVWTIPTRPFSEAHFATMPPELARRCVLAGTRPGDTVLDPFNGAGTTGYVAQEHGREYVGIELNPEYIGIAERRLAQQTLWGAA